MQKINSQVMKSSNALMILKTVRQNAPISRTKLVECVGLTAASVINITNAMLSAGVLVQSGLNDTQGQGRRAVVLDINPEAAYVMGVHLSTDRIVAAMADMRGTLSAVVDSGLPEERSGDAVLACICACIDKSMAAAGVAREKLLGIGLSLPGPLDAEKGVLVNPPNFPGMAGVPIREILEARYGLPVCCDRESNNAALAEYLLGAAAGYKTSFFISLFRSSVGGGMISGGNVLHGFCDSAGEIGHTMVDSDGFPCSCGNSGCLEAMISERAILKQVRRLCQLRYGSGVRYDPNMLTLEDVFRLSAAGDPVCGHVVRKTACYISTALGNAICLYSPEVIVLGGPLPLLSSQLVELIRAQIAARPYPRHCSSIRVVCSSFGESAFVAGAAEHAWNRFVGKLLDGAPSANGT